MRGHKGNNNEVQPEIIKHVRQPLPLGVTYTSWLEKRGKPVAYYKPGGGIVYKRLSFIKKIYDQHVNYSGYSRGYKWRRGRRRSFGGYGTSPFFRRSRGVQYRGRFKRRILRRLLKKFKLRKTVGFRGRSAWIVSKISPTRKLRLKLKLKSKFPKKSYFKRSIQSIRASRIKRKKGRKARLISRDFSSLYGGDRRIAGLQVHQLRDMYRDIFNIYLNNNRLCGTNFRRRYWYRFRKKGRLRGRKIKWFVQHYFFKYRRKLRRRFSLRTLFAIAGRYVHYGYREGAVYNFIKGRVNLLVKKKPLKSRYYIRLSNRMRRVKYAIKRLARRISSKHYKRRAHRRYTRGRRYHYWRYKSARIRSQVRIIFAETKNNFIISYINRRGGMIKYFTAGTSGFSGPKRSLPYAAFTCGQKMRNHLNLHRINIVTLVIKSRIRKKMKEALRGFTSQPIRIKRIVRRVTIPHNGVRKKKLKRK